MAAVIIDSRIAAPLNDYTVKSAPQNTPTGSNMDPSSASLYAVYIAYDEEQHEVVFIFYRHTNRIRISIGI